MRILNLPRNLAIALLCLFPAPNCISLPLQSEAVESASGSEARIVEVVALLKDRYPQRDQIGGEQIPYPKVFESTVFLDEILAEQDYVIQLNIENPTAIEFPFDRIQTGCLCSKGEFVGPSFPAGKTSKGKVHIRMASSLAMTNVRIEFSHKTPNGKREFTGWIDLNFKIAGHLAFRENRRELRTNDGAGRWSFPFSFSPPVRPEALTVKRSAELKDALVEFGEFDKENGVGVLIMTLPETMIDDYGIHGDLVIT